MRSSFDFKLEQHQLIAAARRNSLRINRRSRYRHVLGALSGVILAVSVLIPLQAFLLSEVHHFTGARFTWIAALIIVAAFLIMTALEKRGQRRAQSESNWFTAASTLKLEEGGLRIATANSDSFISFAAIVGVDETDGVILLLLDEINYIPIAANAFSSDEERMTFIAYVRQASSDSGKPTFLAPEPARSEPIYSTKNPEPASSSHNRISAAFRTCSVSLAQAFKLLLFLKVKEERIFLAWWQIAVFGLFSFVVLLLWNMASVGLAGQFVWYSLPLAVFHIPVLLLGAIFIAQALHRSDKTVLLIQVFLMIMLAYDLATLAVSGFVPIQPVTFNPPALGVAYFFLPALWLMLACLVAAYRYTGAKIPARLLAFGLALLVVALPLGLVYRQGSLWEIPYNENNVAKANYGLETEALFYSQQNQLERELTALQEERKGVRDIFLIGVAGYADQDVFVKEVDSVARLFRERFDASGHIVRLINNNKTLASAPIASATNLKISLNRVAQVMNKEEDILFLFLTSHGSQTQFSLQLWPLKLNQLAPAQLRKMLDETGIKNRIIVVSSCYSGGFIKALSDDHTLVITAAAPDKTSFGCSNENEWTYFGDAYFNQALRKTRSFLDAFTMAKNQIAAREKKEKIDPSNPQMAIGPSMRNTLAALEQEWTTPKPTPIASTEAAASAPPDEMEQYLNLIFQPENLAQQVKTCLASMAMRGPDTVVQKNPEYFSGMNKSSAHWPLLMAAWDRYATAYCERVNDTALERSLYSKYLRRTIPSEDLLPALNFLNSESGHRWYVASHQVARQMSIELAQIQTAIDMPLSKIYFEEQTQILQAYQKENQQKNKANK